MEKRLVDGFKETKFVRKALPAEAFPNKLLDF